MAILEIKELTKIYSKSKKNRGGALTALDSVSFSVDCGEVVGFIGPNGAGKSTAIKCVTGLARQTSGTITVDGFDTVKERVRAVSVIGAIIENPDMYTDWSGEENLRYLASLHSGSAQGKPPGESAAKYIAGRVEDVLKLVGLYDRRKDKVGKYSLGMKQRLGIAQALLSRPKLLILDEPTNGLDPSGIKEIREIIINLAHEKNMAVLISSHALAELQQICDRFLIIQKGKIAASFTAGELSGAHEKGSLVFTVDDVVAARDILKEKFGVESEIAGSGKVEVKTSLKSGDLARELILGGVTVNGISEKGVTLEELFMKLTADGGKDETPSETADGKEAE